MTPDSIYTIYSSHPGVVEIQSILSEKKLKSISLKGISGSAASLVFASLFSKMDRPVLIGLNDREEAAYFYDDLTLMLPENNILFLPSSYKRSVRHGNVEHENIVQRTEVLNWISKKGKCIIVTYPDALIEKVISPDALVSNTLNIAIRDKLSIDFISDVLAEYEFERVDFVYEPGQYSVRGGIIDIFSFAHEKPFRVDFFGNEVESIRSFDIDTQLSIERFDAISIIPNIQQSVKEEKRIDFFSFLPEDFILAFRDIEYTFDQIKQTTDELESFRDSGEEMPSPDELIDEEQFLHKLIDFQTIEFGNRKFSKNAHVIHFTTVPQPLFNKNFELLAQELKLNWTNGYQNYILSNNENQIERLRAIFDDKALNVKFTPLNFTFHEGFIDRDIKFAFYTDHQIFERYHRYKLQTTSKAKESISIKELNKLHVGDYVVHIDHGVGKFAGLVKTEINGKTQEAIRLVYKDNDSLLVSLHSLHRISKFKGHEGTEPNLNKLGTGAWQKMKARAKSKVKDIAKELIALYAERLKERGFAFAPDTYMQQELEASFMYEDTPDQYKAVKAVKEDMERLMPMDRLVCGDVGFGKTEVAIRAAFKAVADNKQVAVLVPTTILALQHYKTFSERLKNFPVNIEYVSRLRNSIDTKNSIKKLSEGKVDIIIGTHRLVGKDIKFKDLGLLIVDEEQKFGVGVKEKLKQLKINVDTLTLTATPIPRTLQFSLMGARDLSIIQTPPPNRYPIITEIHGFNEAIIREAINFEIDRGGQVFFIHNRVQNIHEVEAFVRKTCPDARVIVGHGQMDGSKLEKIMLDFIEGKYDVLIATTIIESGLDIPNANTIIINHAQNFGLSDLHQLRGRVGRSNKKAFCYLLSPPMNTLTQEAQRRLKAIEEFSELGSGFNIAMRDLDIRGAGNLLGGEQSGFIADIGFETYHRILDEAVQELKQEEFKEVFAQRDSEEAAKAFLNTKFITDCNIETDMEMRLPENYVNSISERMSLYRELDNIETEEELVRFENQITDRFGKMPEPVCELLEVVRLRWIAISLGMERVVLKNGKMACFFIADQKSPFYQSPAFTKVLAWVQKNPNRCKMKEEKDKLSMTFDKIKSVGKAKSLLTEMG
ncbi:MAG TPA: transcription-repair coupling factor [Prolixibacteraceae bacterium]|nr:transcription-repair coupling factor [Prolixibacteraceae bacterium]